MTEEEKQKLKKENPELYHVAFERGTEAPFSGKLLYEKGDGSYSCAVCGQDLFNSKTKFDSGTGWPSFYDAISGAVLMKEDNSHGMSRTETLCSKCGAHLGHVFNDGPTQTGKRYCINSVCLDLKKQ